MKILAIVFFIVIISGCKPKPNADIDQAAVNISGAFITQHVHSSRSLRIKGGWTVKKEGDHTFYVIGSVEGFSSFNVPISIEHFNESVHYSGGDINDIKNWQCLAIQIGKNKVK